MRTFHAHRRAGRFALATRVLCCAIPALLTIALSPAAEWQVATNGTPAGKGTIDSPWDLESTLQGRHTVEPGDTVWIAGGAYRHPNRRAGALGYEMRLAGSAEKPVQVRALPGQRVMVDGGLNVQPPSTQVWLRDLEIAVSENFTGSRRIEEPGSHPESLNRPWGGLNVYCGAGCKFINLIIHDNAQGVSWWTASKDSELHGCIIYDNGWEAPDRGHGHAIYTQNAEGVKTISDCIMTGGHGYALHAYGSSRADVNNYLLAGNIGYHSGPFLIGSGKPSHGIRVFTNFLYGVPLRLGYDAPTNDDCEVLGNVIVNASLAINKYKSVVNEGNLVLTNSDPRPNRTRAILRPNRYDPNRANLVILNWEKKPLVQIEPEDFLKPGESFRILNPTNFFGKPVLASRFDGKPIGLPVADEFAAYVLIKN